MKTLHLLRHAKSSWRNPGLADRDRGLNKRGARDAPNMGRALATRLADTVFFVSTANRAQLTLAGLCEGAPGLSAQPQEAVEALYTFSAQALLSWIAACHDDLESVLIIGHNPALTDSINTLLDRHALANLPTAGYARLLLDIDQWCRVEPGCGRLEELLLPRTLENT